MSDTKRNAPASTGANPDDDLQGSGSGIDLTAEHATVGAVVLAAAAVQDKVLSIVRDDDFADARCRFTIEVARRMRSEDQPVDPLLLLGYVNHHGLLEVAPRMTLSVWLSEVTSAAPCIASAGWYAELLVEEAARRAARYAAMAISDAAEDASLADLQTLVTDELATVVRAIERVGSVAHV